MGDSNVGRRLETSHGLGLAEKARTLMDIEDLLREVGCRVTGVAGVDEALTAMSADRVDLAVLNIQLLEGRTSFDLASALQASGIPFVFTSGSGGNEVPKAFEAIPFVAKPFQTASLLDVLENALQHQDGNSAEG